MTEKELNLPLFYKHRELMKKQNEIEKQEREENNLSLKMEFAKIQKNIESVNSSLSNIADYLQKINGRKATTLMRLQEEAKKLENDKNNLLPPLKNHNNLQTVVERKEEFDNLLSSLQESENVNILELAQTYPVELACTKKRELANDISAFRTMEDLYNNVIKIKEGTNYLNNTLEDKYIDRTLEDNSLGCYPYEDNSRLEFATSSPIHNKYGF